MKKSLATTLILLLAYQVILPYVPRRYMLEQVRQQGNILKAEEYLCSSNQPCQVIVGSSLSARLNPSVLGKDCFNLALNGGSALTGLELLVRSGARPRLVLVEINNLDREVDRAFVDDEISPVFSLLRRHFSIFREENRPADLVAGVEAKALGLTLRAYRY